MPWSDKGDSNAIVAGSGVSIYPEAMILSDIGLARRLERAEGFACAQFAEARRRLFPDSAAEWMELNAIYAVFDGKDSPVTQTFGFGLSENASPALLDALERFFLARKAPVLHEVSPLAGIAALDMLCTRNYRPVEISSVLYRALSAPEASSDSRIKVRVLPPGDTALWTGISTRGWIRDYPGLADFFLQFGAISAARRHSIHFLAEFDGTPGAAGILCLHDGVALFGGASTIPELRCRGLQAALLQARLRYAFDHGCDVAAMAAEAGSASQRNAERCGFRIAYTRTKWMLSHPADDAWNRTT